MFKRKPHKGSNVSARSSHGMEEFTLPSPTMGPFAIECFRMGEGISRTMTREAFDQMVREEEEQLKRTVDNLDGKTEVAIDSDRTRRLNLHAFQQSAALLDSLLAVDIVHLGEGQNATRKTAQLLSELWEEFERAKMRFDYIRNTPAINTQIVRYYAMITVVRRAIRKVSLALSRLNLGQPVRTYAPIFVPEMLAAATSLPSGDKRLTAYCAWAADTLARNCIFLFRILPDYTIADKAEALPEETRAHFKEREAARQRMMRKRKGEKRAIRE